MGWGGRDTQQNQDKQGRRRQGSNGGDSDGGSDNRQGQQLKTEIQQIIRDELKAIVDGNGETGERLTRVHGNQRFHVRKPIKVGDRARGGARGGRSRDPVIRHDIELLTQVQMELSEELAENLKQLKTVIAESQALAERIQAVLGQNKTQS